MKHINTYILSKIKNETNITEKLKIPKNQKPEYTLFPKSKDELAYMIEKEIKQNGVKCSLNHIDVSEITDLSYLFSNDRISGYELYMFNGDISEWDVSNVTNMFGMFYQSKFNSDISRWDVSNVKDMSYMFKDSEFNEDISRWDVSNVKDMYNMFSRNKKFNQDISNWKINNTCNTFDMFNECNIKDEYKPFKNGERI